MYQLIIIFNFKNDLITPGIPRWHLFGVIPDYGAG